MEKIRMPQIFKMLMVGRNSANRKGPKPMTQRFENFTARARNVLTRAQEEAQRFRHNYIGTEHLLLGLLREPDGIAGQVLIKNFDVTLDKVRDAVALIIQFGDRPVEGQIGLTPRSKEVIELSVQEARCLNHNYVGTEHILLALVQEGGGIAAEIIKNFNVSLPDVTARVVEILNSEGYKKS